MEKMLRDKRVIAILIAPSLTAFLFAVLAPIVLSFIYSFTNSSGIGRFTFVGFENYSALIKDGAFWNALLNSVLLAAGFVLIQHPIAILTAWLLDRIGGRLETFFKTAYFIPNIISSAVIATLWKYIYNTNSGLFNVIARFFGGEGVNWLGTGKAIWSVLIVLVWHGFGWGMLIYYTGIKNIDPVLYEAAAIDGCDDKKMFFAITLPLMRPVIQVNVTLALISALKQMETVYLLTKGGPGNETQFVATYLYKQAFQSGNYGYGNTISVVFIVICLITTVFLNRLFRERGI
ncbi:MAG: sugar ABC transporter permease [Oscillospiraceae bacterium]|nr:sugar ABC transporter permease [Oscillospiraceae bacterium]